MIENTVNVIIVIQLNPNLRFFFFEHKTTQIYFRVVVSGEPEADTAAAAAAL